MKELPGLLLDSLNDVEGFNRESFINVHESGEQVTSIRINPAKTKQPLIAGSPGIDHSQFTVDEPIPWSQYGFYLKERPSFTFDPLFHAGCYYVQEASSMFLEQALKQLTDLAKPLKVLDLCGAPGGKSTHIQSLITPQSLLVSNEIIKGRNNILVDNIIKWGGNNVIVTNNDPVAFKNLEGYFHVLVVDAPCSGSGLFRKDEEAIEEWSPNNVHLCSQRQQRILADSLDALKEGGILIYSTCSYSPEEDEEIADWLTEEFKMKSLELQIESNWNIIESFSSRTKARGYRFYPDKVKGEGLFMACFQKTVATSHSRYRAVKPEKITAKESEIIKPWLTTSDHELLKERGSFFSLPAALIDDYSIISFVLKVQYKGTIIGQIMKDRVVPEHSLALSTVISDNISANELSYEQAIKYLQRHDLNFNTSGRGWQLVKYKGSNLGWINVLPNRINNYYPKELRILKQRNDSAFEK